MARAIQRVGEYYGHKHDDLRLRTEYRQHLRESRKKSDNDVARSILGDKVGFARTDYGS